MIKISERDNGREAKAFWAGLLLLTIGWLGPVACSRGEDAAAPAPVVTWHYVVVNTFPHDPRAFTEGLIFADGHLLESTGLTNRSTLRQVDLDSGKILKVTPVADQFAEGLTLLDGKLYQLTWLGNKGFIYDPKTLTRQGEFHYAGQGWGLTTDGHWLIMSDGSSVIQFLDPATFKVDHTINVTKFGDALPNLNELEWVKGEIFANIWKTDWIARIDPKTGVVTGMIDCSNLLPLADRDGGAEVLNGIAYDAVGDRLFLTGKYWPKIFEVRLKK